MSSALVNLPDSPYGVATNIERNILGTKQVVRFTVTFSPQGPQIIAAVKKEGFNFTIIPIADLPPFTPSSKETEVLAALQQRAIACFHGKVHFLPKDLLARYQQWKTGNGGSVSLSNDSPNIQQYIETITPGVKALELALQQPAPSKLSFLGIGKKKNTREKDIGEAYLQLGEGYRKLSQYPEAILAYQYALESALVAKDIDLQGCIYTNLGKVYFEVGEYKMAIEFYYKDLEIAKQLLNLENMAVAFGNLGLAYKSLGQYEKAIENYEYSLKISIEKKDFQSQCINYNNLGVSYLSLGNKIKAFECYEKQLEISKQISFEAGEQAALIGIGHVNLSSGDMTVMFEFDRALKLAKETGNLEAQQSASINVGDINRKLEEFHSALRLYNEALDIAKKRNDLTGQQIIHSRIGDTYKIMGKYQLAIQAYRNSIDAAVILQKSNSEGDLPTGIAYFGTLFYPSHTLEELLVTNIKATPNANPMHAALLLADGSRSRSLVEVLVKEAGGVRETLSIDQMQNIAAKHQTTFLLYSCSPDKSTKAWVWVIPSKGEVTHHFLDLTPMKKEMKTKEERLPHLKTVEESRGHDFSAVTNWVTRGRIVVTEADLAEKRRVMQLWYKCLIGPITKKLPQDKGARLTIVPDATIAGLPFSLFMGETGETLLELYTLSTVPSIQTLVHLDALDQKKASTRNSGRACIVANPAGSGLTEAEKEGKAVAKHFNEAELLIGETATLINVKQALPKAGFIHLSCHGLTVDQEGNPIKQNKNSVFQGSFQLAGSNLYAEDLMSPLLNAKLAVLSACNSGKGSLLKEGVVGPIHALLAAGASTVIGTLWAIDDLATRLIMERFYHVYFNKTPESQEAQEKGRPFGAAEALREALLFMKQEVTRGNLQSPDPYDPDFTAAWGAFFLVGLPGK